MPAICLAAVAARDDDASGRNLGLPQGRLERGAPADLIRFDPDEPFVLIRKKLSIALQEHAFRRGAAAGRGQDDAWSPAQIVYGAACAHACERLIDFADLPSLPFALAALIVGYLASDRFPSACC